MRNDTHSPEPESSGLAGDQTLMQELVWSVGLIGGVIAFLVLVVQFAG
jgi:hypothetical protein